MDERRLEDKTFAPGYGEFFSGSGHNYEANALAVPVDALSQPTPSELQSMSREAIDVFEAARSGTWNAAAAALDGMQTSWDTFSAGGVPGRLSALTSDALDALSAAVRAHESVKAPLAALGVGQAALDLQLRYRPEAEIDRARFELWTRELQADAAARDSAAVVGDVTTLDWIRDRIPLAAADARRIDDELRSLEAAAESGELKAASAAAERLRGTIAALHLLT